MLNRLYAIITGQSKRYIPRYVPVVDIRYDMENAMYYMTPFSFYSDVLQKELQKNIMNAIIDSTSIDMTVEELLERTEEYSVVDSKIYAICGVE